MNVIQNTPQYLKLRLRPWFAWFVGGTFLTVGLLPTVFTSQQTLQCDCSISAAQSVSPSGQCELRRKTLLWESSTVFAIDELQRAELETVVDTDGDRSYRVLLHLNHETVPLAPYYTGYYSQQEQVNRINAFLETDQELSLLVQQDDRALAVVSAVLVGGSGLLVILLFGQIIICEFDKQLDRFVMTQRGLLRKTQIQQALRDVVDITLTSHRGSKGGWNYRVNLLLNSGEAIALTPYYSSGRTDKERTADQIRQFLNLE